MAKIIKKHSKKVFILALIFLLMAGYFLTSFSRAATISTREVRITNSTPGATATYDFLGTTTASSAKCIKVQFCTSPNTGGSCTGPTGLSTVGGAKSTTGWAVFDQANWTYASTAANSFKLTYGTGENGGASSSWVVDTITNPSSAGAYYAWINTYDHIDCATTPVDDGVVATIAVDAVTASATILETLSFTVTEIAGASCLAQTTGHGGNAINTTTTTIPFGTVNSDVFYNGCMSLAVSTNAGSGYTVSIGEADQLTSGSNQIADGNCDGACSETDVAPWDTSTNNGFAYCMKDSSGDGAGTADDEWATEYCGGASEGFKIIPDTGQPEARNNIMSSLSEGADTAEIDYSLSVDALQAQGTYTTTITYVVTPTY